MHLKYEHILYLYVKLTSYLFNTEYVKVKVTQQLYMLRLINNTGFVNVFGGVMHV